MDLQPGLPARAALARFAAAALLLAAAAIPTFAQQNPAPADARDLAGLWGIDTVFAPAAQGELTLTRRGGAWTARIAGLQATSAVSGDSLRLALPGGRGWFRGRIEAAGARVAGFWIRPAGMESISRYATPLVLRRAGPGVWRGVVTPLEDRYQLYASIQPDSAGALTVFFRNPQRNQRGGARTFRVERAGDSVRFVPPGDTAAIRARLDRAAGRLVVAWPALGADVPLRRMRGAEARGFYARVPPAAPYRYRAPVPRGDGWRTAQARAAGLDPAPLERLVRRIEAADPADPAAPQVHSLLVARHGRLALEEYFHGHDAGRPHDLRSASKTFAGVLLGAWRLQGLRLGPETRVLPLFARYGPPRNPDPRKDAITLGHLLTMTSGLACDENDAASPGNENTMQSQTEQPDWYRFALDLPMARAPGERYAYCSASPNLAAGAIRQASGEWLVSSFDRLVARPLGITRYHVNVTPADEMYFGGGVRMLPRDLLKFGQLYLDGGVWNGRRVVAAEWVARSTRLQTPPPDADGLGWHLNQVRAGGRVFREYEANGNGGQLLMVLPELDLAVVVTAGNYNAYNVWRKFREDWLAQSIIPAVVGR
ncbi:MAG TPA: serine hydrolase [Longimicrobium sp.]|nr:serine hydrolase [Longimicrobium sp.]